MALGYIAAGDALAPGKAELVRLAAEALRDAAERRLRAVQPDGS